MFLQLTFKYDLKVLVCYVHIQLQKVILQGMTALSNTQ
jgi:hypothetical protein